MAGSTDTENLQTGSTSESAYVETLHHTDISSVFGGFDTCGITCDEPEPKSLFYLNDLSSNFHRRLSGEIEDIRSETFHMYEVERSLDVCYKPKIQTYCLCAQFRNTTVSRKDRRVWCHCRERRDFHFMFYFPVHEDLRGVLFSQTSFISSDFSWLYHFWKLDWCFAKGTFFCFARFGREGRISCPRQSCHVLKYV